MTNSLAVMDIISNPTIFSQIDRFAQLMASSQIVPDYLKNKPGDCFMIAQQAIRWNMDPFAVAQCTSVVRGKLCYEGKLVAAVVEALSGVQLDYKYDGQGLDRAVTVLGKRKNDSEPVSIRLVFKDVKTTNDIWNKSPDQMLAYRGAREWARRYAPGTLLGIYTNDEIEAIPSEPKDVTPKPAEKLDKFKPTEEEVIPQVDPNEQLANEIISQLNTLNSISEVDALSKKYKNHVLAFPDLIREQVKGQFRYIRETLEAIEQEKEVAKT